MARMVEQLWRVVTPVAELVGLVGHEVDVRCSAAGEVWVVAGREFDSERCVLDAVLQGEFGVSVRLVREPVVLGGWRDTIGAEPSVVVLPVAV